MALPAVGALLLVAFGWILTRFERFSVVGDSMAPGLLPGDRLLVRKLRRGCGLRLGDVVVAARPGEQDLTLVKRIVGLGERFEGPLTGPAVWLTGDNPGRSTDSRDFGPVPLSAVAGKVVYRYAPPARAGRLRPVR